ncbi:cytochrome c biogenesis protein DipZ [Pantoea sp. 18069]|uniref:cytochrome c biogenesis protein DipZ n=1 Tax=Pantoea sp. 18069 TaxID=2681415 RepID=UPI001356F753|nr:cytochrome c biogenesis protein DipZ [Pantoea sp. 18069]
MTLLIIAYLGGVLTIVSPCILPVLPFVFARADKPFVQSALPLLAGMALTFAAVASLAAVGGGWAVQANQYGRIAALVLMAFFGLSLLVPRLADTLTRPLVAAGHRLSQSAGRDPNPSFVSSVLLGVATGLLWAPCAGPILGLVLTGAALNGANAQTSLLLLAYAAGAATSLAAALTVGGRIFTAMKKSLGAGEWIRRGLGVALLGSVAAIALGLDTDVLARLSLGTTSTVEQALIDRIKPQAADEAIEAGPGSTAMMAGSNAMMVATTAMSGSTAMSAQGGVANLPVESTRPSLGGAVEWLNSPPLTMESLRGKVVLVDFWTYSCINCLRTLPYVRAWAQKYKDQGLVVIGVHTPEFAFEKNIANVRKAARDLQVGYPIAVDNDYAIWRAFRNRYWPAHYFIDAQGRVRHHHFGEGSYAQSERVIQQLLAEAASTAATPLDLVTVDAEGVAQAPDMANVRSPETYLGHQKAENFISPGGLVADAPHTYTVGTPRLNEWGLAGDWTVRPEHAESNKSAGAVAYRFHARDLHLVLGPGADGKPVRFQVTIDGAAPGDSHGVDIGADGTGVVEGQRLYQLIRQAGPIRDRTFEIRFLDPGAQVFAFTFG